MTKLSILATWTGYFNNQDDAYLYMGNTPSVIPFFKKTGIFPVQFAADFLDGPIKNLPKPTIIRVELLQAMTAYWAYRVNLWRRRHKTRKESQTMYCAEQVAEGSMLLFDIATGKRSAPTDGNLCNGDPLAHVVKYGNPGHERTAVMYAKVGLAGCPSEAFGYEIVVCMKCHKECEERVIVQAEIVEGLRAYAKEDAKRARAVKKEW